MTNIERRLRRRFRVKGTDDVLPFRGWAGTRITLAKFFGENDFNVGVEIGVCKGKYSEILCLENPNLHLYSVDPWKAYNKLSQSRCDARLAEAKKRLSKYNAEIIQKESLEAVKEFPDGQLDFVYIDGLHTFDAVIQDIIAWNEKVRVGGIMAGHDYCIFYRGGVIEAVQAYTHAHNINNWYITRDREASWFWVKK